MDLMDRLRSGTAIAHSVEVSDEAAVAVEANARREALMIFNNSSQDVLISFSEAVSETEFTFKIVSQGYYESGLQIFTGAIRVMFLEADESSTGTLQITELEK